MLCHKTSIIHSFHCNFFYIVRQSFFAAMPPSLAYASAYPTIGAERRLLAATVLLASDIVIVWVGNLPAHRLTERKRPAVAGLFGGMVDGVIRSVAGGK